MKSIHTCDPFKQDEIKSVLFTVFRLLFRIAVRSSYPDERICTFVRGENLTEMQTHKTGKSHDSQPRNRDRQNSWKDDIFRCIFSCADTAAL